MMRFFILKKQFFFVVFPLAMIGLCGLPGLFLMISGCGSSSGNSAKMTKEEIDSTLELRISMESYMIKTTDPVNVKLEFVGHPENFRGNVDDQKFTLLPDVICFRGEEAGMAMMLELFNGKGEQQYFADEDTWMNKVALPGISELNDHVYRKLKDGVIETVALPLSRWFEFPKGAYVLRVHYQVSDPNSFWSGPVTSNELMFQVY